MKKNEEERTPGPNLGSVKPVPIEKMLPHFLDDFESLSKPEEEILKGSALPAFLDIYSPGSAKSNVQTVKMVHQAVRDHKLQSPMIEAVRAMFSAKLQAILMRPESHYDENDKDLYKVTWSLDGKEMRIDLTAALVPRQWGTPKGHIRRVWLTLHPNLPNFGTGILLDLSHGQLREDPRVESDRRRREAAKAAKAAKAGQVESGGAQPKPANTAQPPQPNAKPEPTSQAGQEEQE